eukprot:CAMPEP_0196805622 /NCGR_PEP_ID=MMETSP1362-20130617/5414_1 /TAXON_ID=163516 /ORGANISM="Leptocylindrus danicus, Strain CCMP1856" /LENGTH=246 /DNA_ID=CAMNT_0042178655 /DNA_START=125 /DNA_END=865 /DNA_ORIENTATION=-
MSTKEDKSKNTYISTHPVLAHKISILRSSTTPPSLFRALMREITYSLAYEATSTLLTKSIELSVQRRGVCVEVEGSKLQEKIAIVPILRGGLGMIDALLELLPNACVHHIGMYTNKDKEGNGTPVQYYNKLPRKCESDIAYILDPAISSANTMMSVIGMLKKWGVSKIHVVTVAASSAGLKRIQEAHPDVHVTLGTVVDAVVAEDGRLVFPGIGDAGDRLFGTGCHAIEDDEALLRVSKRKRTMSM